MEKGVCKRSEIEGKDNSSKDKSNYKLVKENDIVYNSMRMWQGASGVSKYIGIVSPAYTVLKPKKNVYSDYFRYKFKTPDMINEFRKYSQGLTSDTWNLKYPQIKDIKIKLPVVQEQQKIANFFSSIYKKINKEKEKLDLLKEWKKGLLQQMFV
nr:restriction endonuclease subunit S [Clostridium botulinum]